MSSVAEGLSTKKRFVLAEDQFACRVEQKGYSSDRKSFIGNHAKTMCTSCLFTKQFCICAVLPDQKKLAEQQSSVADVILYAHVTEMLSETGCNTGRWLVWSDAKSVVSGYKNEEELLRQEILRRPKGSCGILFPTSTALIPAEFMAQTRASLDTPQVVPMDFTVSPMFPASITGVKPLIIVLDGTWNSAKMLDRRINLLLSEYVDNPDDYIKRVKLGRECRGSLGSFRRVSKNEKNTINPSAKYGLTLGQRKNETTLSYKSTDPTENAGNKVSTFQAFLVFLEELYDLPLDSYMGTYAQYHAKYNAKLETSVEYDYDQIFQTPVLEELKKFYPPQDGQDDTLVAPFFEKTDTTKRVVHEVVCEMAYLLKTAAIHYHAQLFMSKAALLPEDMQILVAHLLRKHETVRQAKIDFKQEKSREYMKRLAEAQLQASDVTEEAEEEANMTKE